MTVTTSTPGTTGRPTGAAPSPGGRIALAVVAMLLLLAGWAALAAGAVAAGIDVMGREDGGYLMGDPVSWTSPGYAAQSDSVLLHDGPMDFTMPHRMLGRFHVTAVPSGSTGVFIGIGRSDDVSRYLHDVARTTMTDPYDESASSRFVDGGSPRVAPTDADFWVASAVGAGPQEITWDPRPGSWRLVVMNAEGTTPVAADVAVGAEVPALHVIGPVLLVSGVVLLCAAAAGGLVLLRRT